MEPNSTSKVENAVRPNRKKVYRQHNAQGKSKKFNFTKTNFNVKLEKRTLLNNLNIFINGLLGGIAFSLGAVAFLSVNNKYMGSALFTVGMVIIFVYGFGLYTSKVGYCLKNNKEQNLMLIPIWLGNLVGAILVGGIFRLTRTQISDTLISRANQLSGEKFADNIGGILILSIFCGFLMFIATDSFKNAKNAAQKYITLFLTVMVFLLCDFEHFTSSAFFFTIGGAFTLKAFWYLIIMSIGNTLGALIIPACHLGVIYIRSQADKN